MRRAKMLLFAPQALARPEAGAARRNPTRSRLPDVLRAERVPTRHGAITLLRIYSFDVDDQPFIDELLRLLPRLDPGGLVIDLRDNPGGTIWAAERALQLFTPKRIVPTRFSLLATPLARRLATIPGFARQELAPWRESLEDAVRNGELYSRALPITPEAKCNEIGQVYGGPVLLVANSSTYSSGDLFTAGFVDNAIGPYLCVGEATAGGGANVYGYADLRAAFAGTADALPALPEGIELSLSFRRATRAGPSQGLPIEDVGVRVLQARDSYAMTRRDLLEGNCDLYDHCAQRLAGMPRSALDARLRRSPRALVVTTQGVDQLDVEIDGKAMASMAVGDGRKTRRSNSRRGRGGCSSLGAARVRWCSSGASTCAMPRSEPTRGSRTGQPQLDRRPLSARRHAQFPADGRRPARHVAQAAPLHVSRREAFAVVADANEHPPLARRHTRFEPDPRGHSVLEHIGKGLLKDAQDVQQRARRQIGQCRKIVDSPLQFDA